MKKPLSQRLTVPLRTLVVATISAGLSACLSGGSSSNDVAAPPPAQDVLTASVNQGSVRGVTLDSGVVAFRGLRYGAAPVDELRFAAPQPAGGWDGTLQLSESFASACPQAASPFGEASTDEDCLFLNVYRPAAPGDYPVMVWIHGGAFIYGSGGPSYDPSRLVDEGVVVVTLNYRLGALGFLPHASLPSTNFGLQDQRLALQWVQENIQAFDGDPNNVTIFGESAGGHSVLSQLAYPDADGLFHKAIVQSGSYNGDQIPLADTDLGFTTIPGGQTLFGEPTIAATECAGETGPALVSCLRELDVAELLAAQPGNILPVTGTESLPVSINTALASGDFNQVPVMMGSNLDEGALFTLLALAPPDPADLSSLEGYRSAVAELLAENPRIDARAVADYYMTDRPAVPAGFISAYTAIGTDWRFNCPNDQQWTLLADKVDTYGYWFADRNAPAPESLGEPPFPLGAAHSFEIQYVLGSLDSLQERGASEDQLDLARQMTAYWANFAKYGDQQDIGPSGTENAADTVDWPRYTEGSDILRLDAPTPSAVPVTTFRTTHQCDFWKNPPVAVPN